MARNLEKIEVELLRLTPPARAALAKKLLDSLEDLSEEENERLWADEAEARYADFKTGRTKAIPGDQVLARARSRKS